MNFNPNSISLITNNGQNLLSGQRVGLKQGEKEYREK